MFIQSHRSHMSPTQRCPHRRPNRAPSAALPAARRQSYGELLYDLVVCNLPVKQPAFAKSQVPNLPTCQPEACSLQQISTR